MTNEQEWATQLYLRAPLMSTSDFEKALRDHRRTVVESCQAKIDGLHTNRNFRVMRPLHIGKTALQERDLALAQAILVLDALKEPQG